MKFKFVLNSGPQLPTWGDNWMYDPPYDMPPHLKWGCNSNRTAIEYLRDVLKGWR